jgi:hypothetical protein
MREFFKPLRRLVGVATLVMACVFAFAWVRSLHWIDRIIVLGTASMRTGGHSADSMHE